jgi:SRSO17 transposase
MEFCDRFGRHFVIHGNDSSGHARHYLSGLLGCARRKHIGRIGEDVAQSNYQGMQQFVSDSPWDHEALMEEVGREAEALLGGHRDTALYLDETSFVKKGGASVGVQRQYWLARPPAPASPLLLLGGRLGKLENCQVGVFACLGRGERTALVDFRLFLPEAWTEDAARCAKVKVPEAQRVHRTKAELALELVGAARARGSSHQWIGADEVYGNNRELTDALDDLGETFLMDVAQNLQVWAADPAPQPPGPNPQGRPATRARAGAGSGSTPSVAALAAAHFEEESRTLTVRETTKGPLRVRLWVRRVWLWDERRGGPPRPRLLIVRREADGSHQYSLSNAPADTSWKRLGFMQAQRFFIERAFQDAKSELGMAHYEVRGWRGWHHHIALCGLALLFTLKERIACAETVPLLSVRDIVELLDFYLPRQSRDPDQVLLKLRARHAARAAATASARKKRKKIITK